MAPGKRLIDPLPNEDEAELDWPDDDARATAPNHGRIERLERPPIRAGVPTVGSSQQGTLRRPPILTPVGPGLSAVNEASAGPANHQSARRTPDDLIAQVRGLARVSIVMPTLNEARNLPYVLPNIPPDVFEVILVDGHSIDDTIQVARALLPAIRVVMESQPGKGAALCAGFRAAKGDIIVTLDADGSTDPSEIPRFVDALLRGADFAKGSRFLPNGGSTDISRLRAFGNRGFVTLVRVLFGGQYTDLCYGYNAFWASVLPTLALDGAGFEIETMMNVRALREGLRVTEVPSFEKSRIHGVSHLRTFRDGWRVLLTILSERLPRREVGYGDARPADVSGFAVPLDFESPQPRLVPVMDPSLASSIESGSDGASFDSSAADSRVPDGAFAEMSID